MIRENISKQWRFETNGAAPKTVDLPHDYSISLPRDPKAQGGGANGYFVGGDGTYTKFLTLSDEHLILDIDGAYTDTRVWLNEDRLSYHPHGYTPWLTDLTGSVMPNKLNKLVITTCNRQPSTRWYSGAGIYRDVFLWHGGRVRVEPRDLFLSTLSVEGDQAKIALDMTVTADKAESVSWTLCFGDTAVRGVLDAAIGKNAVQTVFTVDHPKLWDIGQANLYDVTLTITAGAEVLDRTELTFGIRTVKVSVDRGLEINGKTVKLKGGCCHHDHGALGAACFPAAEYRRVKKLQAVGFNAIRVAHNPPSTALMEICDREGVILMDEAFDMWRQPKSSQDYSLFFDEWWRRDVDAMVLRDRIHPCILAYSTGNEVPDGIGSSDANKIQKMIAAEIRRLDATRPVSASMWAMTVEKNQNEPADYDNPYNGTDMERFTAGYCEGLDIVGYNYEWRRYENHHKLFPNRVIWGSENKALEAYGAWKATVENSFVFGDFCWTCWDNLGEAGMGVGKWESDGEYGTVRVLDYPHRSCYQGDFDLAGFRRPQSYYREAIWDRLAEPKAFTTDPARNGDNFVGSSWHWHDVADCWNYDDRYIGTPIKAEAYSTADEVTFTLNGKEVARVKPVEGFAYAEIPYAPGTLVTRSFIDGRQVGQSVLETVGEPAALSVTPERDSLLADNRDLCYFDIAVCDKEGRRIPTDGREIACTVDGGELLCVFSGNPFNEDQYTSPNCHLFYGNAVAIVRAAKAGNITVTVAADGVLSATATAEAKEDGSVCGR